MAGYFVLFHTYRLANTTLLNSGNNMNASLSNLKIYTCFHCYKKVFLLPADDYFSHIKSLVCWWMRYRLSTLQNNNFFIVGWISDSASTTAIVTNTA